MSLYNADGQINLTPVSGLSYTGLYAADGSWNIVINDGTTYKGYYHPCGAVNTVATTNTNMAYAPNGSLYVVSNNFGSYSPATSNGGVIPAPSNQTFLTITDNNGVEQSLTVTDTNGVEQFLTIYTG